MNKQLENELNLDNTQKARWIQPAVSLLSTEATEGKDYSFTSETGGMKYTGPS
ncbi:MAG: hypothetical protein JJU03_04550 [Idiomarina sp.]|nr:hypothetical protein [Idiomarina sp.]